MNKKLLKVKKAIEQIEEIENLIVDARKTIKSNERTISALKNQLSWEKDNKVASYVYTQDEIYLLQCETSWKRDWMKDAKVEKQEIEKSITDLFVKTLITKDVILNRDIEVLVKK